MSAALWLPNQRRTMKPAYCVFISFALFFLTDGVDHTLFLPIVVQDYCFDEFVYDEAIPWNLQAVAVVALWNRCGSRRGSGITVAIVDSGIDLAHPDLMTNTIQGKSFVPGTDTVDDQNGHGTHLAGIIAAVPNNGGLIGVAPQVDLMPVKVLDALGSGSAAEIAQGIIWATDHHADIINLSIGSPVPSTVVEDALAYADEAGVLIIGAAGNCGGEDYQQKGCAERHQPDYPGLYSTVIAVSSVTMAEEISNFSSQGAHIELAAPGEEIYSTYIGERYKTLSGTSFAVAHVAGAAALIWSQERSLSNQTLRALLQETAIDFGEPGIDEAFGYGMINPPAALDRRSQGMRQLGTKDLRRTPPRQETIAEGGTFMPGELLVKLKPHAPSINLLMEQVEIPVLALSPIHFKHEDSLAKRYLLQVPTGTEENYVQRLSTLASVAYVELNYRYYAR